MEIIDFYASDNQEHWLEEIKRSDWGAGQYLYELLRKDELRALCGSSTKVLLLVREDDLLSFCTYAKQDEIREPFLTPWVGFVYTFPGHRGHRYAGMLLQEAHVLARREHHPYIYISTGETGLYEKYGYTFWKMMKDVNGEDSRVYRMKVSDVEYGIRPLAENEIPLLDEFLYQAIFIPEGVRPPDRAIIRQPELQVYIRDFGKNETDHCLVADADGKIVGAVWARIMDDYGHVDDETPSLAISLLPEYRNKGIGTALMLRMLDLLAKSGYRRTSLAVQKANYAAGMYEAVGFGTVDENDEEYIMVCRL